MNIHAWIDFIGGVGFGGLIIIVMFIASGDVDRINRLDILIDECELMHDKCRTIAIPEVTK